MDRLLALLLIDVHLAVPHHALTSIRRLVGETQDEVGLR